MRINKYLALSTGISRRNADTAVEQGRVQVNGVLVSSGVQVQPEDVVLIDGEVVSPPEATQTIILNKPVGYVVSRDGQGSKTVYDLLPQELHALKPVGRLDKDSSGLLLLTNDGALANQLTHPRYQKDKVYLVTLDHNLTEKDWEAITKHGVRLEDGKSMFALDYVNDSNTEWKVTIQEGRNRQIRRTFAALGYKVEKLHRTQFGGYSLQSLGNDSFKQVE